MLRLSVMVFACALCHAADAGTIYKCHEGARVSYGDRPCRNPASGGELAVHAAPAPDPDLEARLVRAREIVLERDQLRADQALREDREAERAARAGLALRKRCDKLRLQGQWLEEDLARSRGDAREAVRTKVRRHAETLAVECPA